MVIEDHFLISTQIEAELRELGYSSFDFCDDEESAVAAANSRCPELITADDRLVSGTGIRAVETICAERVIPVVLVISNPHDLRLPVPYAVLVSKPFGGRELRRAVADAVSAAEQAA